MKQPKTIAIIVVALIVALVPIFFKTGYTLQFIINILMFAYLASSWNIIGGYGGQLALGNGVYFGIGAYVSTIMFSYLNISPFVGMIVGGLIAGVLSLLIGSITFRLSGSYYALSTVALLHVIRMIFLSNTTILGFKTNGALGLQVPWRGESLINMQFVEKIGYYYIIFIMLALVLLLSNYINKSKDGYYLAALNTNPEAAGSLGINVKGMKLKAGFISAFLTAAGGTFYAQLIQIVDPSRVLGYDMSVQILLYAVIGGRGTLWGPVLAAALLVPLNDALRAILGSSMAGLPFVIYGVALMLIIYFMPEGIFKYIAKLPGLFSKNKKTGRKEVV